MIDVQEITDTGERKAILSRTALDIVLLDAEPDEYFFTAAHGCTDSFAVLRDPDAEITIWRLSGGTKVERKERADAVRDRFAGEQGWE